MSSRDIRRSFETAEIKAVKSCPLSFYIYRAIFLPFSHRGPKKDIVG